MIDYCRCGSLKSNSKCTNIHCGDTYHPRWSEAEDHMLIKDVDHGRSLIRCERPRRTKIEGRR